MYSFFVSFHRFTVITYLAYGAIFTRLSQALDQNMGVAYSCAAMLVAAPIFTWTFMYGFGFGYWGAALAQSFSMSVFCITQAIYLWYKGFGYIFKPQPLSVVWTKKGMTQYINLALPGLAQSSFQWIIEEMAVLLAGWVADSTIALSTSVILTNVLFVVNPFGIGASNATNIRVGKYIGLGDVPKAKRSAKIGVMIALNLLVMWCLIFIFGRNFIPTIYTDDEDTIALTAEMILMLIAYSTGCFIQLWVGGIYRGLGFQKVAAVITFISFWIIAWPICLILLFAVGLRENLFDGVCIIWSALSLGNILAALGTIAHMFLFVDWEEAVKQSQVRVKKTISESYDSSEEYDVGGGGSTETDSLL